MKYILLGLLISLVFLGVSCQKKESSGLKLTGTEWKVTKWSSNELNPNDFTITASFTEDTMSGKSAVNQYNGPYTTGLSNEFSVGTVVMTRMAGSPAEMKAEQIYHDLLVQATKVKIDSSGLALQNDQGVVLLFFASK